jgi:hypothetical protein
MKSEIEQWKKRIEEIDSIIDPLHDERGKLKQKLLESKSIFKVGDVIEWVAGSQKRRGQVIEIRHWVCDCPMWFVQNIRQDGSRGSNCEVRDYMHPVKIDS